MYQSSSFIPDRESLMPIKSDQCTTMKTKFLRYCCCCCKTKPLIYDDGDTQEIVGKRKALKFIFDAIARSASLTLIMATFQTYGPRQWTVFLTSQFMNYCVYDMIIPLVMTYLYMDSAKAKFEEKFIHMFPEGSCI